MARTRHDFPLWEVAREEVVIDGHELVADSVLLGNILHYSVDQQKGKPGQSKSQSFMQAAYAS
jgi:hypothetical protein